MRFTPVAVGIMLTLVAAITACGDSGGDAVATSDGTSGGDAVAFAPSWRTITDTLGDTVVVRTVGATDEAAALRLVEELRIGDFEGADEYQFADVRFVVPAPDSGVYVWDHILASLRQYDGGGQFVRRIGQYDSGPGEYRTANGLVQFRDGRLVLWDPENLRMNVYDSAGRAVESWRYESTLGVTSPWGLLADTADNVYANHQFRPADAGRRTLTLSAARMGYRVLGPDGVVRDSVLPPPWLPRATELVATLEGGGGITSTVPFAPQPRWTVSRSGHVVSGVGDRYAITLHRPGAPLRIEREVEPVPVDPDEKANAEEIVVAEMRQADRSWRWNGPSIPGVKASFREIRPAADGRVWVERGAHGVRTPAGEAPPPGFIPPIGGGGGQAIPPRRWREPVLFDLFAVDGRFLGTLHVPDRARVLHMYGDHVWGVETDSLDVPSVVRWRIEPSLVPRERSR